MSYPFVQQPIKVIEHEIKPVKAPDIRHPTHDGWVNQGEKYYIENFGIEDLEKYNRSQFSVPMPPASIELTRELNKSVRKAKFLLGLKALVTGRRTTHFRGVAGRGKIHIVAKPEFPDHEFFTPGREFSCRLRHANASFDDDLSIQVRGCSLKFADTEFDSPLDILMNTGAIAAFWNLDTFMVFVEARRVSTETNWDAQKEWLHQYPAAYISTVESVRTYTNSYTDLLYWTKIAYPFKARDGRTRYAKYRIIPAGLTKEGGMPTIEVQKRAWWQARDPNDTRPQNMMQQEYKDRLKRGPQEYSLQIQLWDWDEDRDSVEVFNLCRYWNEDEHPWLDLAQVKISEALPDKEMEPMRMWLGNQPPSLGITDADSIMDYRSLPWSRVLVYPVSQKARAPLRFLRGLFS